MPASHQELRVWQNATDLASRTRVRRNPSFPYEEIYGLTCQMPDAKSGSVDPEQRRRRQRAPRLETHILIAQRLKYMSPSACFSPCKVPRIKAAGQFDRRASLIGKSKNGRTRSKFRSPRSDVSCLPSIPAKSKPQPSDPRPSPAFQSTGPSLSATDSLRLKSDAHPTNARAAEIAFSILRRKPAFSPIAFPPLRSCAKAIPPQSPAHRIRGSPALAPRNLFACSHAAKFRSPAP